MSCEWCDGGVYSGISDGNGGHSSDCPSLAIKTELNSISNAIERLANAIESKEVKQ